jgi:hypothetical protein
VNQHAGPSECGAAVKQWRCRQTGAQLASGDVLKALRLDPWKYPNAYAVLRAVSHDIGTVWIDQAGRQHRLYVWGDLPVLGTRMLASGKLRRRDAAASTPALWRPPDHLDLAEDDALVVPFDEVLSEAA